MLKKRNSLEVIDAASSKTVLEFNYYQDITDIEIVKTKEMAIVAMIEDKDNFKYALIDLLNGNSQLLTSFD